MKKLAVILLATSCFAFTPWYHTWRIVASNTSKSDTVISANVNFLFTVKGPVGMYVTLGTAPCSSTINVDTVLYRNIPILPSQQVLISASGKTCVAAISMDTTKTDTLFFTQGK